MELYYYSCFASKVVSFGSTETPKLAVCYFAKQPKPASLFQIVTKLVSVIVSAFSRRTKFRRTFYIFLGICVSTVASLLKLLFRFNQTSKLAILLFRETTETNLFVSDSVKIRFGSSFTCFDINRVL